MFWLSFAFVVQSRHVVTAEVLIWVCTLCLHDKISENLVKFRKFLQIVRPEHFDELFIAIQMDPPATCSGLSL